MRQDNNKQFDTQGASSYPANIVSSQLAPYGVKKDEKMKKYTYQEIMIIIIGVLHESMYGVGNGMAWNDYKQLMIPSLKRKLRKVIQKKNREIGRSNILIDYNEYNSYDIDYAIKHFKGTYEVFGQYQGYSRYFYSVQDNDIDIVSCYNFGGK